jgi:hypothetical protein
MEDHKRHATKSASTLAPKTLYEGTNSVSQLDNLEIHTLHHSSPTVRRSISKQTAQHAQVLRIFFGLVGASNLVLGLVTLESRLAIFFHFHVVDQAAAREHIFELSAESVGVDLACGRVGGGDVCLGRGSGCQGERCHGDGEEECGDFHCYRCGII